MMLPMNPLHQQVIPFIQRGDGDISDCFTIPRRDGNENVKNNNKFSGQNNIFARVSHFFVHFFAVFARLRREIA